MLCLGVIGQNMVPWCIPIGRQKPSMYHVTFVGSFSRVYKKILAQNTMLDFGVIGQNMLSWCIAIGRK